MWFVCISLWCTHTHTHTQNCLYYFSSLFSIESKFTSSYHIPNVYISSVWLIDSRYGESAQWAYHLYSDHFMSHSILASFITAYTIQPQCLLLFQIIHYSFFNTIQCFIHFFLCCIASVDLMCVSSSALSWSKIVHLFVSACVCVRFQI